MRIKKLHLYLHVLLSGHCITSAHSRTQGTGGWLKGEPPAGLMPWGFSVSVVARRLDEPQKGLRAAREEGGQVCLLEVRHWEELVSKTRGGEAEG